MRRLLFLLPFALFSLEHQPYFGDLWEFYLTPAYTYRYYPAVQNARNPSSYNSHDHIPSLNLRFSFLPKWDAQIQTDFASTRKLSYGTQSVAASVRYLALNDIAGDPISLSLSLIPRYVPTRSLKDPSTPYHAQFNLEAGIALGKEIDNVYNWLLRTWGYLGIGQANRGSPWLNAIVHLDTHFKEQHQLDALLHYYMGFGTRHHVDIDNLNGYAKIQHRSLDIGAAYRYHFLIWGTLALEYSYRIFARAFPKQVHTATIKYTLPFSLF